MTDRRLIEEWLPIAALGEESVRERRSMTALPPTYYLHVWWARRPLVASRAAILGALLPADADRDKFMHLLGIHGDPVAAKKAMEEVTRQGTRIANPYTYKRAFTYTPDEIERAWTHNTIGQTDRVSIVLDPTAGGGSIPFESMRLGCSTIANDLNPVAWLTMKATCDYPASFAHTIHDRYTTLAAQFLEKVKARIADVYPASLVENQSDLTYLWARTITCPYCSGRIPLSPNWRLNGSGTGVRLKPDTSDPNHRYVTFEIVQKLSDQSPGTVKDGTATCPFHDCCQVIASDEIKQQACAGNMGEQLYAIVYKRRTQVGTTKKGVPKYKEIRGFRAPTAQDDVDDLVASRLAEKTTEWEALNFIPNESLPPGNKTTEPIRMGMTTWRDLFSARQLYGHCTSVEVYHELLEHCGGLANINELDKAALTYIALAIDKMLNYNARMVRWHANREVVAGVFDRHDFAFKWSYAEMAPTITGLGYDWAIKQTGKALEELIELTTHDQIAGLPMFESGANAASAWSDLTITCGSADHMPHIEGGSTDAIIMDPPYYDNVMYAELADFFYVWLKRTAGLLFPEQFATYLTDKDNEAVANVAKYRELTKVRGSGGAAKRAARDYRQRMEAIFAECHRVLKADGIMVLMFTHKATGAWDALATGLIEAGFEVTASWPVNTEAEGSLHIKDKNAAKSTIFLVCRPRATRRQEAAYWEDVEPLVASIVRKHVQQFQDDGIRGVDLYLSCFGPALQVFSEHWPIQRGQAMQKPETPKGITGMLFEDEDWDPYAVTPEDALTAARVAVKNWRLDQIGTVKRHAQLDPLTEFFILAWDTFESPQFPADEALKLSRVVGTHFDTQLRKNLLEIKASDVILHDSVTRSRTGALGSLTGGCLLDALHHAARVCREQNVGQARDMLERAGLLDDDGFKRALQALLEVLPPPRALAGAHGAVAGAAADCDALERLRQLVYAEEIPQPVQFALGL